jgi:ketosteroid isomerase-like protein
MRTLLLLAALAVSTHAADFHQQLLDADRAFDLETAARGLDGWMVWFAPDARLNTLQGEIRGAAALRQHYSAMFARKEFSIRWQPFFADSSKDGTLGYTLGTAVISWKDEAGVAQKRDGRYLTVWKRQPDGRWKAVTDMGS